MVERKEVYVELFQMFRQLILDPTRCWTKIIPWIRYVCHR